MTMNLAAIREFCIQHGITPEELDEVNEPPVVRDIGEALTLFLQNDDELGSMIVMALMMIEEQSIKISELEAEVAALKGGVA